MTRLTPRQLECLGLAAQGLSAKQIARHLRISEGTVKNTRFAAVKRLKAKSTAHAVALLMSRGEISRCSVSTSEAEAIVVSGRAA